MPRRSCGACHACCVSIPIRTAGWHKPGGERCKFLSESGRCKEYESRPEACRVFQCAWLTGALPFATEWRPDNLGLVLMEAQADGEWLVFAYETWRNASRSSPTARELLERMSESGFVVVVENTGAGACTTVLGPPELHEAFVQRHGSIGAGATS